MIATRKLAMRMADQREEHRECITRSSWRTRNIDDQRLTGDTGKPSRQWRGHHSSSAALLTQCFGNAGDFVVDHRSGHLRSAIGGGDASATIGEDQIVLADHGEQRLAHFFAIMHNDRICGIEPGLSQTIDEDRSAEICIEAIGGPVGNGQDSNARPVHRRHSPVLPPDFDST